MLTCVRKLLDGPFLQFLLNGARLVVRSILRVPNIFEVNLLVRCLVNMLCRLGASVVSSAPTVRRSGLVLVILLVPVPYMFIWTCLVSIRFGFRVYVRITVLTTRWQS